MWLFTKCIMVLSFQGRLARCIAVVALLPAANQSDVSHQQQHCCSQYGFHFSHYHFFSFFYISWPDRVPIPIFYDTNMFARTWSHWPKSKPRNGHVAFSGYHAPIAQRYDVISFMFVCAHAYLCVHARVHVCMAACLCGCVFVCLFMSYMCFFCLFFSRLHMCVRKSL